MYHNRFRLRLERLCPWIPLLCVISLLWGEAPGAVGQTPLTIIPGLAGFGTETPAGRGGMVVVVDTLNSDGPGSLKEAMETAGPRTILFAVGGVIDLNGHNLTLTEPFVTIAGQSAPAPGITLIKGGIDLFTHDVLVQHIAVRPGDNGQPRKSGFAPDGINIGAGSNIVIDHCSITWGVDENLSASGPRHEGRQKTSHDITIANCIIAEALRNASHEEGAHSMGSLIHDHVRNVSLIGNLYACNVNRNPVLKPDAGAVIVNNLIFNPGQHAIHTYWSTHEYKNQPEPPIPCEMAVVGNVLMHGKDTWGWVNLITIEAGKAHIYASENQQFDARGILISSPKPNWQALTEPPLWPAGLSAMPVDQVPARVLQNAGSRPADRDEIDGRIIDGVRTGSERIIDSQSEAGGYPTFPMTRHELQIPDHPNDDDDGNGYTNLEDWLHSLADQVER